MAWKRVPVTRFALIDRLAASGLWPAGTAADVRRFFRYLDYWRQQTYNAALLELEQSYRTVQPGYRSPPHAQVHAGERHPLRSALCRT